MAATARGFAQAGSSGAGSAGGVVMLLAAGLIVGLLVGLVRNKACNLPA